jgi:hypothetical protein
VVAVLRRTLFFSLDPHQKNLWQDDKRHRAWAEEVRKALQPLVDKVYRNPAPDFFIDLDSPKLPQLVKTIEGLRKRKVARMGSGHIEESLVEDDETRLEWFVLRPKAEFEEWATPREADWPALHRLGVPTTRADRMKHGVHVAGSGPFVSERVKAVLEEGGVTGIELVWIPDVGKYAAPQWYLAIGQRSLGRGLDHPWFDPSKFRTRNIDRRKYDQPTDPTWRYGVVEYFFRAQFRSGAGYGDRVTDRLISMFRQTLLHVVSYRRVLRKYLPDTDFGYVWRDVESLRGRALCFNRKARDLLVDAGLVAEDECQGVEVLDRRYPGAELLDTLPGGPGGPGPRYSTAELAEIRAEEAAYRAQYATESRPAREEADAGRAIDGAKKRKKSPRVKPDGAASEEAIRKAGEALPAPIPPAWQEFLRTLGGAYIRKCVLTDGEAESAFAAPHELAELQSDLSWIAESMEPDEAAGLLWVGGTGFGDGVALDAGSITPEGECRVLLISHETMEAAREWDSVAAFLEELLAEE